MEWFILVAYGVFLWILSPWSSDRESFFKGRSRGGDQVGFWLLTGSVFISWIFAKSITNAANLGARYGLVGGLAYAAWFFSIPVAGVVIYWIRKVHQVESLPDFVMNKYGRLATMAFLVAIFIRLFNEIWSNTIVVGTYFGAKGSGPYYAACFLFTAVTLAYSLRGGLRSSIITDGVQLLLMVFFLALVLGYVVPEQGGSLITAGEFTLRGGLDLLLVGLLQSLSYPFHDPVLTDRGFISDRRTMLKSFLTAGGLAVLCIGVFSLVGVYAFLEGMTIADDAPPQVAASFGTAVMVMMNIIMLSSAGSTLDSTLSSLSRELVMDVPRLAQGLSQGGVTAGRVAMVVMAVAGNLPLFTGATILQATTLSGTMVMGLAPVFLFFWWDRPGALSFHLAFWTGLFVGLYEILGMTPAALQIGEGPYAGLLGLNVYGLLACVSVYMVGGLLPALVGKPLKEAFSRGEG